MAISRHWKLDFPKNLMGFTASLKLFQIVGDHYPCPPPTVEPIMPWRCTELSKLTSPSLWNLTVDLAARFSQTFFTRASFHRGEEVWLKSFNFQSFFALKIIILYFKTQLSAWNRSIFFLQDLSSRLSYSTQPGNVSQLPVHCVREESVQTEQNYLNAVAK